jgi:hypothetical protein
MQLERDGSVDAAALKHKEELLNQPLRCHRCAVLQKNMPALIVHIKACKK